MVKPVAGQDEWLLADLLNRSMGAIRKTGERTFVIEPDGNARETMKGMHGGPFGSLDEALAMIETHTRGVCRREHEPAQEIGTEPAGTTETSTDMSDNASPSAR